MMDLSNKFNITPLFLDKIDTWGTVLCTLTACDEWTAALKKVGKVNANPARPLQAILLTMRVSDQAIKDVDRLLSQIEYDSLCRYMVVVAIDGDNNGDDLVTSIKSRGRVESCIVLSNPPLNSSEPFMICNVWDRMAKAAWEDGADWVVLLGDDIEVLTPYHYRETYRTFLDIRQNMKLKQECPYFGCPYWNDFKFPGFPSFPVVGRQHYEIFGALIPSDRAGNFINQDLDPYLQPLVGRFHASHFDFQPSFRQCLAIKWYLRDVGLLLECLIGIVCVFKRMMNTPSMIVGPSFILLQPLVGRFHTSDFDFQPTFRQRLAIKWYLRDLGERD